MEYIEDFAGNKIYPGDTFLYLDGFPFSLCTLVDCHLKDFFVYTTGRYKRGDKYKKKTPSYLIKMDINLYVNSNILLNKKTCDIFGREAKSGDLVVVVEEYGEHFHYALYLGDYIFYSRHGYEVNKRYYIVDNLSNIALDNKNELLNLLNDIRGIVKKDFYGNNISVGDNILGLVLFEHAALESIYYLINCRILGFTNKYVICYHKSAIEYLKYSSVFKLNGLPSKQISMNSLARERDKYYGTLEVTGKELKMGDFLFVVPFRKSTFAYSFYAIYCGENEVFDGTTIKKVASYQCIRVKKDDKYKELCISLQNYIEYGEK